LAYCFTEDENRFFGESRFEKSAMKKILPNKKSDTASDSRRMQEYQFDFFNANRDIYTDIEQRRKKAVHVRAIIEHQCRMRGNALAGARILDVGCSAGYIGEALLTAGAQKVFGIDIDLPALRWGEQQVNQQSGGFVAVCASATELPCQSGVFDIVVCNHIYEHVPSFALLVGEIARVLRPSGICYFAATNKFAIMESDYHLPFLSWLPRSLASIYLRLFRGIATYYEHPLSLRQLRSELRQYFAVNESYTIGVVVEPERFGFSAPQPVGWVVRMPGGRWLLRLGAMLFKPLFPSFIFVLDKK
jgi:2-polyprenyl-3-methyl-5-hydroxy-6-metoxy-1,4-benzoquinol methylase